MCKNAHNPCPGCAKHRGDAARWMSFEEDEARRIADRERGIDARAADARPAPTHH